jgi:transcription elongation factor Elf1
MSDEDFWDFVAFWEFFNPFEDEDKSFKCPFCGREIKGDEKVEVDKERKVFKCPDCDEEIEIK